MTDCVTVSVSLPEKVIRRIDDKRGDVTRSRFLLRVLEKEFGEPAEK